MKRGRKLVMIAVLIVVLPVTLAAVWLLVERFRGKAALARVERTLRQQGLKLNAAEFALPTVQGENGAPALVAASERLTKGGALPDHAPPRMQILPSGRAIVGFRENEWDESNNWEQVAADISTNAMILDEIKAALQKPVLRNPLDFSQGIKLKFDHLGTIKTPASWYGAAAQLALRSGQRERAAAHCVTMTQLQNALREDRLVISELVRIALGAIARTATWEALQLDNWPDGELAGLQKEWEDHEYVQGMIRALEGELVFMHESYKDLRKSYDETVKMLFWMEDFDFALEGEPSWSAGSPADLSFSEKLMRFFKRRVYVSVWRFSWMDQAHARSLTEIKTLLRAAREAAKDQEPGIFRTAHETMMSRYARRGAYDKLRYPEPLPETTLSMSVLRSWRAETERGMAVCAIAIKRFAAANGKLPASLQELSPRFLQGIPLDWMDGKPMKYRLNEDGTYVLYSSGNDGKDDGGDVSKDDNSSTAGWWKGKDVVWPAPATGEEAKEWREKRKAGSL